MKKLVSIVVPIYNAEKYITNCIEALQKQIYTSLEIILVDDGSTDRSLEICNRFAAKDQRIKVVHKDNGGVSSARNAGIEIASGEYLMFADSDDMAGELWVKRMVELAVQWHVNYVICGYRTAKNYAVAGQTAADRNDFERVWAFTRNEFYNVLGHMMVFRETMFCPWNKLFFLDIVKKERIRFPEDMEYGEDFLFNLQYLEFCNGVIETKEKLYVYILQNPSSLEAKYKPDLYENQMKLYEAAKSFMIGHGVYHGFNVENLAYYCTHRVMASIQNQFHAENDKTEYEKRQYIEGIFYNRDVVESVFIADLHENQNQAMFTDFVKSKQYDRIYGLFKGESALDRQAAIRFKEPQERPCGWGWFSYALQSVKEYGLFITVKRIMGKVGRKVRGK